MDRKNLIALIAGCLAALLLICILLVGILDDIWPWDGVTAYSRLITGRTQATIGPKETTAPTEETDPVTPLPEQQGGAAGEQQQDPSKPTIGEIGQNPLPPTLPLDEEIQDEIGGVVINPPSGSDKDDKDNKDETTESTPGTTLPADEKADKEVTGSMIPVGPINRS